MNPIKGGNPPKLKKFRIKINLKFWGKLILIICFKLKIFK